MPSLSIITPSFNQGRFIARTVESVLSQGLEVEYVIMDGGSCDDTLDVLKAYQDRVKTVSEKDKGQADALNKGLVVTSGEIIGWLNSDDVYYPGAFQAVLDHFRVHPEADVVYGQADHIDINDQFIEEYPTEDWDVDRLEEVCFLCQPAVFFRRRVVERFGLPDANLRFCMDYEYWLRLGLGGAKFHYLQTKLAGSRFYPATKTLGQRLGVHAEINDMMEASLGYVPDIWLSNWAHALVRDKLDLGQGHRLSTGLIALCTLGASLYWNHEISAGLAGMVWSWLRPKSG